jgi:hypothetical protein
MLELAGRLSYASLNVPVLFAAFTLEEPPAYLTGHQGSRFFVRQCQKKGHRVLGAVILEMVGYTAPYQHYPFIARWPGYPDQGNFIGINRKLALMALWTGRSEGLSQEPSLAGLVAVPSL